MVEAEPFEVFVGGLPEGCTSEMLLEVILFQATALVCLTSRLQAFADAQPKSARIKLDDKSKKSRGFGFVCFYKEKYLSRILEETEVRRVFETMNLLAAHFVAVPF